MIVRVKQNHTSVLSINIYLTVTFQEEGML